MYIKRSVSVLYWTTRRCVTRAFHATWLDGSLLSKYLGNKPLVLKLSIKKNNPQVHESNIDFGGVNVKQVPGPVKCGESDPDHVTFHDRVNVSEDDVFDDATTHRRRRESAGRDQTGLDGIRRLSHRETRWRCQLYAINLAQIHAWDV